MAGQGDTTKPAGHQEQQTPQKPQKKPKHPLRSAGKVIPCFQSSDIRATLRFYVDELGFKGHALVNNAPPPPSDPNAAVSEPEPDFCSIAAGRHASANFYFFKLQPGQALHKSWALINVGTASLERLWEDLSKRGAERVPIVEDIGDRDWGYRQFSVADPDGNKVTFWRFLEGSNPADVEENREEDDEEAEEEKKHE